MTDITRVKLGKKPPRIDSRTLKLEKYLSALPAPPPSCDWTKGVTQFGAMLNDELGDCTCAAIGHAIQIVTLNTPIGEVTPPDILIQNLYERSCGYIPGDPSTDNGGVILDVLNWVRQHGLGHKRKPHPHHIKFPMYAFADPSPSDITHVKQAIQIFSSVDIGIQLPITAQEQVGGVWDVVGNPNTDPNSVPGSWGGHSVCVPAYDTEGLICITWGSLQKMTFNFWKTYCDESHALLFHDWIDHVASGSNSSFLAQLEADLQVVTG
jgi:hypothetical protein